MRSLNKAIVSGHLGKDPETTPAGSTTVTKFSLAVNDRWKDDAGEKQERVNWIQVAVFNGNGENVAQFLKKGAHVIVEGALRTSEWDDKESGQKRWKTEIVASNVIFLDKKGDAPTTKRTRRKPGPQPVE
ncbi:MAG TPA: single-stranded DNA-binding protein [Thermoanaerobaculia bacterium]|jgi:single-strand DNA-binding protein